MSTPVRDSLSSCESLKTRVVFRHSPLLFHVSGRLASGSYVLILSHTVNENTLALGQQWNLGTHVLNPQVGSQDTSEKLTSNFNLSVFDFHKIAYPPPRPHPPDVFRRLQAATRRLELSQGRLELQMAKRGVPLSLKIQRF